MTLTYVRFCSGEKTKSPKYISSFTWDVPKSLWHSPLPELWQGVRTEDNTTRLLSGTDQWLTKATVRDCSCPRRQKGPLVLFWSHRCIVSNSKSDKKCNGIAPTGEGVELATHFCYMICISLIFPLLTWISLVLYYFLLVLSLDTKREMKNKGCHTLKQ